MDNLAYIDYLVMMRSRAASSDLPLDIEAYEIWLEAYMLNPLPVEYWRIY